MNNDVLLMIVAVFILICVSSMISQLRNDIARVNSKLNKIAEKIGLPDAFPEKEDEEIKRLISEGKKIQAIKRYRSLTGMGLKEAKEYIDNLSEKKFL